MIVQLDDRRFNNERVSTDQTYRGKNVDYAKFTIFFFPLQIYSLEILFLVCLLLCFVHLSGCFVYDYVIASVATCLPAGRSNPAYFLNPSVSLWLTEGFKSEAGDLAEKYDIILKLN